LAGLVLGKVVGISLASWLAVRCGWAQLPAGVTWPQIVAAGLLAGVGFTMSLFVGELAFEDETLRNAAKLGILVASSTAGVLGYVGTPGRPPRARDVRRGQRIASRVPVGARQDALARLAPAQESSYDEGCFPEVVRPVHRRGRVIASPIGLATVLPLTTWRKGRRVYPTEVLLPAGTGGLPAPSLVLAHQVRTLSARRLSPTIGSIGDSAQRAQVARALSLWLDLAG
jgi:mRNA-degrading endonuclease toxin of MazEF toxin-antitoxin module